MKKEETISILNKEYFEGNKHEKEILTKLKKHIIGIDTFIDIGASLGQYTHFASQNMKNANIISIEADPIRIEGLKKNILQWKKNNTNSFKVIYKAISSYKGVITFLSTESNTSGSLLANPHNKDKIKKEIEVLCDTVDNILNDLLGKRKTFFIKMDIEGGEYDAILSGGMDQILNEKLFFFLECHNFNKDQTTDKILKYLFKKGFKINIIHGHFLFSKYYGNQFRTHFLLFGSNFIFFIKKYIKPILSVYIYNLLKKYI